MVSLFFVFTICTPNLGEEMIPNLICAYCFQLACKRNAIAWNSILPIWDEWWIKLNQAPHRFLKWVETNRHLALYHPPFLWFQWSVLWNGAFLRFLQMDSEKLEGISVSMQFHDIYCMLLYILYNIICIYLQSVYVKYIFHNLKYT